MPALTIHGLFHHPININTVNFTLRLFTRKKQTPLHEAMQPLPTLKLLSPPPGGQFSFVVVLLSAGLTQPTEWLDLGSLAPLRHGIVLTPAGFH